MEVNSQQSLIRNKELVGHKEFFRMIYYLMLALMKVMTSKKLILQDTCAIDLFRQVLEELLKMIEITMVRKDLIWQVLYWQISLGHNLEWLSQR